MLIWLFMLKPSPNSTTPAAAGAPPLELGAASFPAPPVARGLEARDGDVPQPQALSRSLGGSVEVRFPGNNVVEYREPNGQWLRLPHPRNSTSAESDPRVLVTPTLREYGGGEFLYFYAVKTDAGAQVARVFFSSPSAVSKGAFEAASALGVPLMSMFGSRGKFVTGEINGQPLAVAVQLFRSDKGGYSFADVVASIAHENDHVARSTRGETLPLGRGAPVPEITAHLVQRRAYERMGKGVPEAFATDEALIRSMGEQGYPPAQISFARQYLELLRQAERELTVARDADLSLVTFEQMKAINSGG